jgi:hypothetical protein
LRWDGEGRNPGRVPAPYALMGNQCESDDNTPAAASLSNADTAAGWQSFAWHVAAMEALETLARSGQPFSVDDLTEMVGAPRSPKQAASVLGAASRWGLVRQAGAAISARGRPVRLWVGVES